MVAAKDDFYNRHIMKFKLFDPIVQLFVANGRKYNLINSAVIELFDYIRKENIKALLKHVIENYSDTFKEVDYVETFKLLQLKYEQNKDYDENVNKVFSGPTKYVDLCSPRGLEFVSQQLYGWGGGLWGCELTRAPRQVATKGCRRRRGRQLFLWR